MAIPAFRTFIIFYVFSYLACALNQPLPTRGLTAEERRYFVIQNGYGIPDNHKRAFMDGFPAVGMSQDMIYSLYGPPDRTVEDDAGWEYVDRSGKLVTGFKFEDKLVVKITGDPRGGVPQEEPKEK